jgi:hypothetical protein
MGLLSKTNLSCAASAARRIRPKARSHAAEHNKCRALPFFLSFPRFLWHIPGLCRTPRRNGAQKASPCLVHGAVRSSCTAATASERGGGARRCLNRWRALHAAKRQVRSAAGQSCVRSGAAPMLQFSSSRLPKYTIRLVMRWRPARSLAFGSK